MTKQRVFFRMGIMFNTEALKRILKRSFRLVRELVFLAFEASVDLKDYVLGQWPRVKKLALRKEVYIPAVITAVAIGGYLLALNLYFANPSHLSNVFERSKTEARNLFSQFNGEAVLSSNFTDEEAEGFSRSMQSLAEEFEAANVKQPSIFFVRYATKELSSGENEIALLENNQPREFMQRTQEVAVAYGELVEISRPILKLKQDEQNPSVVTEQVVNEYDVLPKKALPVDVKEVRQVFNSLHSEAQQFERSGNVERWSQQLEAIQAAVKNKLSTSWHRKRNEILRTLSELVSDYERMEFLFKSKG